MKVIVITGGRGSGQSYACRYLDERYGWPVYEADARVKQLYSEHPSLLQQIESCLGVILTDEDGRFRSECLAGIIFNDADSLRIVESLVFPVLLDDFESWKSEHVHSDFVILESATIIEKPQLSSVGDVRLLIDAPIDVRLDRAALRDNADVARIRLRMASQTMMNDISSGMIKAPVDSVILNDGSIEEYQKKLDEFVKNIA